MANEKEKIQMSEPAPAMASPPLLQPSLPWRLGSSLIMGLTGTLSRGFLYGLNSVEATGLDKFLKILDERQDVEKRTKGLLTVCNHISVIDDPVMWGVLPPRYLFNPTNMRWGLGAHDICFGNKALGTFFSLGQVLPTHRKLYSEYGGAFQPTVPQAIRLLSSPEHFLKGTASPSSSSSPGAEAASASDPFTHAELTYSTTGSDCWRAPSAYALSNRNAWVHVFPEGCIHQHEALTLRYFKWGASRLILEAEPAPDVLPICIDGTQRMMSEERTFPRFLPRGGHTLRIVYGDPVDAERAFGDLRARWRDLVRREADKEAAQLKQPIRKLEMGELTDELKYGDEAVKLRIEVAKRIRDQIEHLRIGLGYPEDDPKLALAETWAKEPAAKAFKSNVDGSLVKKD